MLSKVKTYIGQTPWDEVMQRHDERWIKKVCLGIVIVSVIYFIPVSIGKIYEVKKHEAQIAKATSTETEKDAQLRGIENAVNTMGMHRPAKHQPAQVRRMRGI